ncbi:hypothetical protein KUTeg_018148 [Tegillarca granosa]|uniref:Uncharacterized protein n=1 Tax=Tegillarca granosa TaxID=220873 RepID=A0ABQ9EH83_TEGGR|nr:hypothetical protein KUTeg_018148 [Tegillarca granosa]
MYVQYPIYFKHVPDYCSVVDFDKPINNLSLLFFQLSLDILLKMLPCTSIYACCILWFVQRVIKE